MAEVVYLDNVQRLLDLMRQTFPASKGSSSTSITVTQRRFQS
ncbi:hypothetical protein VF34_01807 [Rhodococcus sp. PML026]|jgi:hypothetical protein|nr:hypothetical protein VF34_01807 [Rhodococcus sp. PML026]